MKAWWLYQLPVSYVLSFWSFGEWNCWAVTVWQPLLSSKSWLEAIGFPAVDCNHDIWSKVIVTNLYLTSTDILADYQTICHISELHLELHVSWDWEQHWQWTRPGTRNHNKCLQLAGKWRRLNNIFNVNRSERWTLTSEARALHALELILNRSWVGLNLRGARTTLNMRILRQMASYWEVATEDARKRLRRMLEAETMPLITDLLRIKQDGFIYISRWEVQVVSS